MLGSCTFQLKSILFVNLGLCLCLLICLSLCNAVSLSLLRSVNVEVDRLGELKSKDLSILDNFVDKFSSLFIYLALNGEFKVSLGLLDVGVEILNDVIVLLEGFLFVVDHT